MPPPEHARCCAVTRCPAGRTPLYRVSVKREAHGAGSQFVHTRVRPGDLLEVAAPRGTFVLQPGERPVLLVSAGVGATPVLAMLHALAESESGRDVWWLHGARSRADEPFAEESRSLLDRLPHAHRHVCYSRPGPGDVPGRDYQTTGRLSASVLAGLGLPGDADAYIGGPAAFMTDMSAARPTWASTAPACTPRSSAPHPPARRASRLRPPGRRTRLPDRPATVPRSPSPAAASVPAGSLRTLACSNSPKPATSRSAGPAAPASVIPARPR